MRVEQTQLRGGRCIHEDRCFLGHSRSCLVAPRRVCTSYVKDVSQKVVAVLVDEIKRHGKFAPAKSRAEMGES